MKCQKKFDKPEIRKSARNGFGNGLRNTAVSLNVILMTLIRFLTERVGRQNDLARVNTAFSRSHGAARHSCQRRGTHRVDRYGSCRWLPGPLQGRSSGGARDQTSSRSYQAAQGKTAHYHRMNNHYGLSINPQATTRASSSPARERSLVD